MVHLTIFSVASKSWGIISYNTFKISSTILASQILDLFIYLIFFPKFFSLRVWSFSHSPYHLLPLSAFGWCFFKFMVLFFSQICSLDNSELFPQILCLQLKLSCLFLSSPFLSWWHSHLLLSPWVHLTSLSVTASSTVISSLSLSWLTSPGFRLHFLV